MSFGQRLKDIRSLSGMTQEELASKIGVQKQHISRYENDRCEPNIRTAKRIADALGVSLEELSKGTIVQSSSLALSEDETELLSFYRSMNEPGRRAALAMVKGLSEDGLYKKYDRSAVDVG